MSSSDSGLASVEAIAKCKADPSFVADTIATIKQRSLESFLDKVPAVAGRPRPDKSHMFAIDGRHKNSLEFQGLIDKLTADLCYLHKQRLEQLAAPLLGQEFKMQLVIATTAMAAAFVAGAMPVPGTSHIPLGCMQAAMIMYLAHEKGTSLTANAAIQMVLHLGVQAAAPVVAAELIGLVPGFGQVAKGGFALGVTVTSTPHSPNLNIASNRVATHLRLLSHNSLALALIREATRLLITRSGRVCPDFAQ